MHASQAGWNPDESNLRLLRRLALLHTVPQSQYHERIDDVLLRPQNTIQLETLKTEIPSAGQKRTQYICRGQGRVSSRVQQKCTATLPTNMDLIRPAQASDLHQRPASTNMQLVHTEQVTGSIPESPTQLSGRFQSWDQPVLILRYASGGTTRLGSCLRALGLRRFPSGFQAGERKPYLLVSLAP